MKTASGILLVVGLGILVLGFIIGMASEAETVSIVLILIGGLLMISGAILFPAETMKFVGKRCVLVGLPFVIIASVYFCLCGGGWVFSGGEYGDIILFYVAIIGLIVFVPVVVIGTILFFKGRSQEKKQKNHPPLA